MAKSMQELLAETLSQRQAQAAAAEALRSTEQKAANEEAAPTSEINSLYQNYFGRDADIEGLEFYQDQIASGVISIEDMNNIFSAAEEHEYYLDQENPDTDRAFNDTLSRDALQEGEEFYKGMSYEQIVASILGEQPQDGKNSEFQRYFDSGVSDRPAEGDYRYLHTESDNPYSEEQGGDYRGFRNPNTRPLTDEEIAAGAAATDEEYKGYDAGKPWEDWGGWEENPYYDFNGNGEPGGGVPEPAPAPAPRPVSPLPDYEQYGSNQDMYKGQLQQLMAQRARYHDNTDPNLGGPSLGNLPPPLTQPGTQPPRTGNEYIDPSTGQPIGFEPWDPAKADPNAGKTAAQVAAAAQGQLGR